MMSVLASQELAFCAAPAGQASTVRTAPGGMSGRGRPFTACPRLQEIEQTTVTRCAALPRVTCSSAVAPQIACPDPISGLRPVT